jgi:GSH-dependent disulfide-bond oxidoreductase
MLELYHGEPNGLFLKPLIALAEKQVTFVSRYFDPASFAQHDVDFVQNMESRLHLEREGPLLVHDGEVISSSFFMLEYIAETFPGIDLMPGGALEHYKARAIGQQLTLGAWASVSALGCARYLASRLAQLDRAVLQRNIERIEPVERRNVWLAVIDGSCNEAMQETLRERLKPVIKRIETSLTHSPWVTGAAYSIADIDVFATLAPIPDLAPEVLNERVAPRVMEFLQRMRERTAVRTALGMSRTGRPQEAFIPGTEPSRWG